MSDSEYQVRLKTTGRNDDCLCGSGKKYKKCHLAEDEDARTAALKEEALVRTKSSKAAEGEVDTKGGDVSRRSTKHQKQQPGPKGRASDGTPKNIARRGAV